MPKGRWTVAPQDLWYKTEKQPDGTTQKVKSARYGRGKRWRVNYVDPNSGRERSPSFATKTEAENFENKVKADISRGQYIDPNAGLKALEDHGDAWASTKMVDPNTKQRIEATLRNHVYPVLGARKPIAGVLPSQIRGWVADRSRVMAPSTLRVAYNTVLFPMFEAAVLDRMIGSSPCVGIDLPKIIGRDYVIITAEQLHKLVEAVPEEYRAAPWIAVGCGSRGSEIMGMDTTLVRSLHRELDISQQLKKVTGRDPYLGLPKNRKARTVDLPEQVSFAIAEQMRVRPPVELEIEDETDERKIRYDKNTKQRVVPRRKVRLLFATETGRPMLRGDWSKIWVPAVKKAGLPQGFRLHDLRHLFATTLIHHGASVKTVQLALGHASAKTTFETYIHEWPDLADRTRTIMEQALTLKPKQSDRAAES